MWVAAVAPCSPLEFYVEVELPAELALGSIVCTSRDTENFGRIHFYGIVDEVDMAEAYLAHVRVTRIEPDVFLPPEPGSPVELANGRAREMALHFDAMAEKIPAGVLANAKPAYYNLDFLNGDKGAHVNVAGVSGVATKTSYALFLLYSLFHAAPGELSRGIIFNVKGDDLMHLHRGNQLLKPSDQDNYERLGLPCEPFRDVAYYGSDEPLWSLREFGERELVRYFFTETDQSGAMEFAIDRLAEVLKEVAVESPEGELFLGRTRVESLTQLCKAITNTVEDNDSRWFEGATTNTRRAVVRRLNGVAAHVKTLVGPAGRLRFDHKLSVIDLHRLREKAKSFVVGSVLQSLFEERESAEAQPVTTYLVLDELNKYAPREGSGPIRQMLLDVAERGRSLGITLIGAQQTASQVVERVVGNASVRVVGRLECSEAENNTYGWLSPAFRQRATMLQPGSMFISQPQVPVPLLVRFPFPAWATRRSEAVEP